MTTLKKDLSQLTLLGRRAQPRRKLEVFPNHHPGRRYTVTLSTQEFTCLCPATGQPDFAALTIAYIPDKWILESKSLKLYLWSYRDEGVLHDLSTKWRVKNPPYGSRRQAASSSVIPTCGYYKQKGGAISRVDFATALIVYGVLARIYRYQGGD